VYQSRSLYSLTLMVTIEMKVVIIVMETIFDKVGVLFCSSNESELLTYVVLFLRWASPRCRSLNCKLRLLQYTTAVWLHMCNEAHSFICSLVTCGYYIQGLWVHKRLPSTEGILTRSNQARVQSFSLVQIHGLQASSCSSTCLLLSR